MADGPGLSSCPARRGRLREPVGGRPGLVTVSENDPVTTPVVQITRSHPAFGQVAALFDDYRAHYGLLPSPRVTRDWLHGQLAQHQLAIMAAVCAGQACGFITTTVMPASLMLGTAWSVRDLYVAPQRRGSGIARALLQQVIDDARAAGAIACHCRPKPVTPLRSGSTPPPASSRSAAWNRSASPSRPAATRIDRTRASTS